MRFVILAILFIVNITLEYKMYRIAKRYVPKANEEEVKTISEKEKWNVKNMEEHYVRRRIFHFSCDWWNEYCIHYSNE